VFFAKKLQLSWRQGIVLTCIANNAMIDNTELESYCVKANAPNEWIEMIQKYKDFHFSSEDIEKRKSIMSLFNNVNEAKKIIDKIFTA
ncbi:MAG: hypothetical protein ACPGAA_05185, partial [Flavobacteriaceae bacterium]